MTATDGTLLRSALSLPAAFIALRLHLHLHSEAHLNVLHNLASALALWAGLHLTVFRSSAMAMFAVDVTVDVQTANRA